MKTFFLTIATVIATISCAWAQNTASFRQELTGRDSTGVVRIRITEHGDAASVVGTLSGRSMPDKVKGFRVRIFFDNSQSARSSADAIKRQFEEMYPSVAVYMNYENPYFKVTAGDCATIEDAIILRGRIRETFKKGFVIREDIPIDAFKIQRIKEPLTTQNVPNL